MIQSRRIVAAVLFGLTLVGVGLAATSAVRASEMLNVIFIAADDLRCDLACYGHREAITPHLDRLAKRGVLFERAYCQQALCNPSRASLLTGRRPDRLRIWDLPTHFREVDPSIVTLPEHFKQQGYVTQSIGKIFHNWRQDIEGDPQSWSVPQRLHFARHDDDQPQVEGSLPPNVAKAPRCERRAVEDEAYFDGRIARDAVKALRRHADGERPFFLAVGFWKPHLPFNAPDKYWRMYDREKLAPPLNPDRSKNAPDLAFHDSREILRAAEVRRLTQAQVMELRHGYLAGVSYLDAQVGRLLDEVDRLDLAHKTVFVFWSDHGFHLGEHALWCKTSNFELDARVPLIIAAPDLGGAGQKTPALAELLDLYPTLAELCGLPEPKNVDGVSLVPVLKNPSATVKQAAYTQHPRPNYYRGQPEVMGVSVRTDGMRYTQWRDFKTGEVRGEELYDHRHDPAETVNVLADPPDAEAAAIAKRLLMKQFP